MSAFGRLWRRAPAWRLSLLSAIALTGLAAMFPPALPKLHWPGGAGTPASPNAARFHPQKDEVSDDGGILQTAPLETPHSGLVDFAGRSLPLPAGNWQVFAVASSALGVRQLLLTRIVDHRLTGLTLAVGTGVFGGPAGPVGVPPLCGTEDRLAGAIVPALPGDSPLKHECWSIVPADMKRLVSNDDTPALARTLSRLADLGVAVPTKMLAVQFVRSTDRAWQDTVVMVPDKGGTITALSAWAGRYQALLHKGFDGNATAADLNPAAIRDPT